MRIVHTIASLNSRHGGPSRSVTALCSALAEQSVGLMLVTTRDRETEGHVLPNEQVSVRFHLPGLRNGYQARTGALRAAGMPRILHDHGIWLPVNVSSALAANRAQVPLVISTRGMLAPRATSYRAWKKKAAWVAYQRHVLRSAAVLHATSPAELESVRAVGLRNPVAVIPNGVNLPSSTQVRPSGANLESTLRTVLYLSRVHPIKGIPMLLDAWKRVRPNGWKLIIAGPDEEGHTAELKSLANQYGIQGDVAFAGPVDDIDKWRLYAEADLFVLPTHSENFGIVVAEAMAAGLPVITTKGAPWAVLEEERCGWWTDISVNAIEAAIREAISLQPDHRRDMGERGARYVRESLSWASVAKQMREVYEWILTGGAKPSTVELG